MSAKEAMPGGTSATSAPLSRLADLGRLELPSNNLGWARGGRLDELPRECQSRFRGDRLAVKPPLPV